MTPSVHIKYLEFGFRVTRTTVGAPPRAFIVPCTHKAHLCRIILPSHQDLSHKGPTESKSLTYGKTVSSAFMAVATPSSTTCFSSRVMKLEAVHQLIHIR